MSDFPRLYARTQRFTLGRPRTFTVSPDGERIWFLASDAGDDPVHHLWLHTTGDGDTRRLVDARAHAGDGADLADAERARRERAREGGGGIVGYATDRDARRAVFALGGRVVVVDADGATTEVATAGPAFDPRLSPDGRRVAMVVDRGVHAAAVTGDRPRAVPVAVPGDDEPDVTLGVAEFAAAEEMGRARGFWFSPDGTSLLVTRVDEGEVAVVHLVDPIEPTRAPRSHRYPFAGTANATVELLLVDLQAAEDTGHAGSDGLQVAATTRVTGVRDHYLAAVTWDGSSPALVTWQDRAQRTVTVATLDRGRARLEQARVVTGSPWVELVPGIPCWAGDRLVTVEARMALGDEGARALVVDGEVATPAGLQVRAVESATAEQVVVTASRDDPTSIGAYAVSLPDLAVSELATGPGVHAVHTGGASRVEVAATLDTSPVVTVVTPSGRRRLPDTSLPDSLDVRVELLELGDDALRAGLLVPDGPGPFPVLLDPYGGPHAQRVVQSRNAFLVPQWFADRGFAVLVTDNRGSPGRSPGFEHAVHGDLATGVLTDQVAALEAAAAHDDRLDRSRVAIRGWSFGGFLAALAALRRPDVFRGAIVGAPVTDWRLYDTHYTERYLGHPDEAADAYRRSSVVDEDGALVAAADAEHPAHLLVIHGLVDDNVLAAHSLRLSRALLEAGHPHRFLPLSGVTHMTPQEEVAANLLSLQLSFLREILAPTTG